MLVGLQRIAGKVPITLGCPCVCVLPVAQAVTQSRGYYPPYTEYAPQRLRRPLSLIIRHVHCLLGSLKPSVS